MGWLNVDFIDNLDEDIISTNRKSIDWENIYASELREYLASCLSIIEKQWREKRKKKKQDSISKRSDIDVKGWLDKLPSNVHSKVETIINLLNDSPELAEDKQRETIQTLHQIAPEYANLHWRNLEEEIQEVSERYYKSGDYYTAFIEALKKYVSEVEAKTGLSNISERNLMQAAFNGKLLVTKNYKKTDNTEFDNQTIENIEGGQKLLSEGIVAGGRNPLQHEEHIELNQTGLFSEKDCLDFLSLLSHLFKRLKESDTP